ncbi:MAG: hypothetical protein JWN08_490 [Frankiales bacterium]|nr:hypothetical protein [Frankiales bacterium]
MLLTVFTPSHRPRYLDECYRSLRAQTRTEWEWIVLLNGAAPNWCPPQQDDRVKVLRAPAALRGVGAAKRAACRHASGDVLVELDHDDLLASHCLERVAAEFETRPDVVLVYSDFTQVAEDGSPNSDRFNEAMGWVYEQRDVDGVRQLSCQALEPTPHNVSYIWYAPNHVRAFRRDAYEQVGGYDEALEVLDDQELMIRLFRVGDFHRIPECLYLQRVHGANTQLDPATNAHIQQQTVAFYQQHVEQLADAWAARRGLRSVTLQTDGMPGAPAADGELLLLDPTRPVLPYEDGSVGVLKARELLQRVVDRTTLFNECHRVLAPGGLLLTLTPSTDGRGAFQDPSHVAFYNENSFWYVTQANLGPSVPGLCARFQVSHVRTFHPTPWHEQVQIPYVEANLLAVKDGPRQGGPLLW